jgi:hypothetical protein
VRKRGAVPPAVPEALQPAQQAFVEGALHSQTAADPAAALEKAIIEAAAQIISKAIADLQAGRPVAAPATGREEEHAVETRTWVAKDGGGTAWARIKAGAQAMVTKSGGKMSEAESVSKFLATPAGARLYDEYLAETARVVDQHRRSRLDPPPGVKS